MIRVARLQGEELIKALPDVARLRIEVFRAWPYLYDGDMGYETAYLRVYSESADAILVAAYDGDTLVGASTGAPMMDHAESFRAAFTEDHPGLDEIFYCAESVLLPAYRGHGVGHRFFDVREAHARSLGLKFSAFCAVLRPSDHALRPTDYQSLDPFWRKRGYTPLKGVLAQFSWRDLNQTCETSHDLQFWMRRL